MLTGQDHRRVGEVGTAAHDVVVKAWTKIQKVKTESKKVNFFGRTLFVDCQRKFARGYFSVDMFRAVPGEGGGAGVGGRSPHATLVPG